MIKKAEYKKHIPITDSDDDKIFDKIKSLSKIQMEIIVPCKLVLKWYRIWQSWSPTANRLVVTTALIDRYYIFNNNSQLRLGAPECNSNSPAIYKIYLPSYLNIYYKIQAQPNIRRIIIKYMEFFQCHF